MPGNPWPGMHGKPAPSPKGGFDWNPLDWWDDWFSKVSGWLGGLGGDIASGIEGGTISVIKDIWNVILPFIEIAIGALIAMWTISIYLASSQGGQAAIQSLLTVRK